MRDISLVAFIVFSANFRTSSATTANPRPDSPALAASIAAFSASKLVCSAISLITCKIPVIFSEALASSPTLSDVLTTDLLKFSMLSAAALRVVPLDSAVSFIFVTSSIVSSIWVFIFLKEVFKSSIVFVIAIALCVCASVPLDISELALPTLFAPLNTAFDASWTSASTVFNS